MSFWDTLKKPFFALAPMDGVTDPVFRQLVAEIGKPDVLFTEFTNCEGLCSVGKEKLLPRLKYSDQERPIVAQIWGVNPDNFYQTARLIQSLKFDGVDINMGCPDRAVVKIGSGAALIENFGLAQQIILATKKGAPKLPVSVKTRIGFRKAVTEQWIGFLLKQDLAAITLHGRTASELSDVPAHWEEIGKAVQLRNQLGVKPLIMGNGDVVSREDGLAKVQQYGVDGIMIGRGILSDPWVFIPGDNHPQNDPPHLLSLLLKHLVLYQQSGSTIKFDTLKKYFKIYASGFRGAGKLRELLMSTSSVDEARKVTEIYLAGK